MKGNENMKKRFLPMYAAKKRVLLAWITCFVLLLSLTACGKDASRIIPGTWSGNWDFSDDEETIFYDDGSIEDFSWYSWNIVNDNILKIEDFSGAHIYKYTIDEISNKRMTLRDDSGNTVTLYKK